MSVTTLLWASETTSIHVTCEPNSTMSELEPLSLLWQNGKICHATHEIDKQNRNKNHPFNSKWQSSGWT